MKKIYLLFLCSIAVITLLAQTPQAFKYQAIARDEAGNILSLWDISLRVSLIQEGAESMVVYTETHKVQTNIYGLINLTIGEGDDENGDFSTIKWGENRHYIKMEMDIDGGVNYGDVGISQLYAVPYALYAEQAGTLLEKKEDKKTIQKSKSKPPSRSSGSRNGTPNSKIPAEGNSFLNAISGYTGIGTTNPKGKLDVIGKIMASDGYNTNGNDGLTDIVNIVSDIDFNSLKLKYRTLIYSGGISTYISDTSGWVDTVGDCILPPFSCGDLLVDKRDTRLYKTKLINLQCWMAENLNTGIRINGLQNQTDNDTIEKYCYNDLQSNCNTYGGLYQWNEAMDWGTDEGAQGICPDGWHIPTDVEWCTLTQFIDPTVNCSIDGLSGADVGIKMKSTYGWDSGGNGTNITGFNALPGGHREHDGNFYSLTFNFSAWSTTPAFGGSNAWIRDLFSIYDNIGREHFGKNEGYSIRCIKDE